MQEEKQWNDALSGLSSISIFLADIYTISNIVHDQLLVPLGQIQYHRSPVKHDMLKTCPCCMSNPEDYIHFLHCKKDSSKQLPGIAALLKEDPKTPTLMPHLAEFNTGYKWVLTRMFLSTSMHIPNTCTKRSRLHYPNKRKWMGSSIARLSGQIMVWWSFHDVVWRDLALPDLGIP